MDGQASSSSWGAATLHGRRRCRAALGGGAGGIQRQRGPPLLAHHPLPHAVLGIDGKTAAMRPRRGEGGRSSWGASRRASTRGAQAAPALALSCSRPSRPHIDSRGSPAVSGSRRAMKAVMSSTQPANSRNVPHSCAVQAWAAARQVCVAAWHCKAGAAGTWFGRPGRQHTARASQLTRAHSMGRNHWPRTKLKKKLMDSPSAMPADRLSSGCTSVADSRPNAPQDLRRFSRRRQQGPQGFKQRRSRRAGAGQRAAGQQALSWGAGAGTGTECLQQPAHQAKPATKMAISTRMATAAPVGSVAAL